MRTMRTACIILAVLCCICLDVVHNPVPLRALKPERNINDGAVTRSSNTSNGARHGCCTCAICVCKSYRDFVLKVAAARNMKPEEVHKVAKGRIWTGQDALHLGLVDELGGLTRAIALAKQLAHLPQVTILMSGLLVLATSWLPCLIT